MIKKQKQIAILFFNLVACWPLSRAWTWAAASHSVLDQRQNVESTLGSRREREKHGLDLLIILKNILLLNGEGEQGVQEKA